MGLSFTKALGPELFPVDRLGISGALREQIDKITVVSIDSDVVPPPGDELKIAFDVPEELRFDLLGIDGLAVAFGGAENAALTLTFTDNANTFESSLEGDVRVEINSDIVRPSILQNGVWVEDPDEDTLSVAIEAGITLGPNWTIGFTGSPEFALKPFLIASSGVAVETNKIGLYFSDSAVPPPGTAAGFKGIYIEQATIYLPKEFADILPDGITLQQASIGNGGFSGIVTLDWEVERGITGFDEAQAKSLFGFQFTLQRVSIEFHQNTLSGSSISGFLKVPFFDEILEIDVGLCNDGGFTFAVAGEDGLITLTKEGVVSIRVSEIEFIKEGDGYLFKLSGQLTPLFGGLNWPAFTLNGLEIYSDGRIKVDGGWLTLPVPKALDLYGFNFEISQIGFGSEGQSRRWLGFSGGLHLIDMLPAGASVKGFQVSWATSGSLEVQISMDGVGLELDVPNAFSLQGDVSLEEEDGLHVFNGDAKLELIPLGVSLDASLKIGHDDAAGYNFLYAYLDLELPVGVPLWATGAALYGVSGLNGLNVLPAATNNDWYGWYAGSPDKFNVTNSEKWKPAQGGQAFGAGMVLGTLFDAGHVVSVKALFALVLPGPVIFLNGKANFLQVPPQLSDPASEGAFDMLAVLDANAGFLQMNIDAGWSARNLIDIAASAEAYFDFNNPANWHFYLGKKKPDSDRIRAYLVALFHADAYLMISMDGIKAGFGVDWGQDWKFGPVKLILQSSIAADGNISWQPAQLKGSLSLAGNFDVAVAGFETGLNASATLSGKSPTPYQVRGDLDLSVKLPFPLKDLHEAIVLEWKESRDPPAEDPFRLFSVEHPVVDETWKLSGSSAELDPTSADFDPGPVVPLDGRPSLVFDRSVKDVTSGIDLINVAVYPGGTWIGDYLFDYEVHEVTLEKWSKAGGVAWEKVSGLYGSWLAVEDANGELSASKLQLWAKTPFEFTRQTSRTYRDVLLARHSDWPCAEVPEAVQYCVDWGNGSPDTLYGTVFVYEGLNFIRSQPGAVQVLPVTVCGLKQALKIANGDTVWIVFPEPVRSIEVCLFGFFASAAVYGNGMLLEQVLSPSGKITFSAEAVDAMVLSEGDPNAFLVSLCYQKEAEAQVIDATQDYLDRVSAGVSHWDSDAQIFEPETWYRLSTHLETVMTVDGQATRTPYDHTAYFQTDGPPGLTPAWALPPSETVQSGSALSEPPYPQGGKLTDLSVYIQWTIPADGTRPVYRSYDLGAEFNVDYVEQMYGADMLIRLLDGNGLPLQDAEGQDVAFINKWGRVATVEQSETELPYASRVKGCQSLPDVSFPPNQTITATSGLLFEEDFSGPLDQWKDPNEPDGDPNNKWIAEGGLLSYTGETVPALGALLVAGDETWGDYAVEVELTDQGNEVGLVYQHNQTDLEFSFYRMRLTGVGSFLERIINGAVTVLWEDATAYVPGSIGTLAVQCQGDRLRGQADAELLFDLRDEAPLLSGNVGIYTNATASFEHFLVRAWPGGTLAPLAAYSAELTATFVLFQGGLAGGVKDTQDYSWTELSKDKSEISAIGREVWDDYRVEINVAGTGWQAGLIARFIQDREAQTFNCYRLLVNQDKAVIHLSRLTGTYNGSTYELERRG